MRPRLALQSGSHSNVGVIEVAWKGCEIALRDLSEETSYAAERTEAQEQWKKGYQPMLDVTGYNIGLDVDVRTGVVTPAPATHSIWTELNAG